MRGFICGILAALAIMMVGMIFDHITGYNTKFIQGWWGSMAFNDLRRAINLKGVSA